MSHVLLQVVVSVPAVKNFFDFHCQSFLPLSREDAYLWGFQELLEFLLLQIRWVWRGLLLLLHFVHDERKCSQPQVLLQTAHWEQSHISKRFLNNDTRFLQFETTKSCCGSHGVVERVRGPDQRALVVNIIETVERQTTNVVHLRCQEGERYEPEQHRETLKAEDCPEIVRLLDEELGNENVGEGDER